MNGIRRISKNLSVRDFRCTSAEKSARFQQKVQTGMQKRLKRSALKLRRTLIDLTGIKSLLPLKWKWKENSKKIHVFFLRNLCVCVRVKRAPRRQSRGECIAADRLLTILCSNNAKPESAQDERGAHSAPFAHCVDFFSRSHKRLYADCHSMDAYCPMFSMVFLSSAFSREWEERLTQ